MKVLHVIHRYFPAIGGSEAWCINMCRHLVKRGVIFRVATISIFNMEEFHKPYNENKDHVKLGRHDYDSGIFITRYKLCKVLGTELHKVLLYLLHFNKSGLIDAILNSPHSLELYINLHKEMRGMDIVHLHTLPFFHNIIAFTIAKLLRKKVIITPHFHIGHPLYEKKIFYDLMNKCDAVIAVTDTERQHLASKGIKPERLHVIGNSIDVNMPSDAAELDLFKESIFSKYNISEGAKRIIFLGRKELYKGIGDLIEASSQIANEDSLNIALFLVGPDTDVFTDKYGSFEYKEAGKLKVINFGAVKDREKDFILQLSDILILPSEFEAFGIVFLEAWKYKKPVIGPSHGAAAKIIQNAGLGVKFGDQHDLKEKIKKLLYDKELACELGESGNRKLMEEYTLSIQGDRLLDVYNNLLAKKKVLVVSHLFPPYGFGGAEVVAYEQAKSLKKMGYEIRVFAGRVDNDKKRYHVIRERGEFNITRIILHDRDFDHFRCSSMGREALKNIFKNELRNFAPSIVHFHNIFGFSVELIDACSELSMPMVMTLHDYWGICFKNLLIDKNGSICKGENADCFDCQKNIKLESEEDIDIKKRNGLFIEKLNKIDLLISPSEYLRKRFIGKGVDGGKIEVIDYGIDLQRFNNGRKANSKKIRFGYIGQVVEHKGLENILRGLSLLDKGEKDKIIFKVIGKGEKIYLDYCRSLSKELGVADCIKFYGYVDNKKIHRFFREIDVLIVASIWPDNSPVVIRESLASGVPVLGADVGGISELIRSGETGYLFENNSISLAEAMKKIIHNPANIAKMRSFCLESAREKDIVYSVDKIINGYENIINTPGIINNIEVPYDIDNYDFKGYTLQDFIDKGWYGVEKEGFLEWCWSKKEAFLKFPKFENDVELELSGCESKNIPLLLTVLDMTGSKACTVLDKKIGSYNINSKRVRVVIPRGVRSVNISVDKLWQPETECGNTDKRHLGVCLYGVRQKYAIKKHEMSYEKLKRFKERNEKLLLSDIRENRFLLRAFPAKVCLTTDALCNLQCIMCIKRCEPPDMAGTPLFIEEKLLIKFADQVFPAARLLQTNTAGEPLASRTFDLELELACKYGVKLDMFTNGMLLNKKKGLLEKVVRQSSFVTFSLNSPFKTTHESICIGSDFELVKENMRLFQKHRNKLPYSERPSFYINMVLMKRNMDHIPDMVKFAKEIGADALNVAKVYVNRKGMEDESLDDHEKTVVFNMKAAAKLAYSLNLRMTVAHYYHKQVYDTYPKASQPLPDSLSNDQGLPLGVNTDNGHKRCLMLWWNVYINTAGMISPCCAPKQLIIENIGNCAFQDIWNGAAYQAMRKTFTGEKPFNICLNCAKDGFLANI